MLIMSDRHFSAKRSSLMRFSRTMTIAASAIACLSTSAVMAAEGGVGAVLLGSHATGAGITPPPGIFFQNDLYYYDGKLSGGRTLPTGGLLIANISAQSWI
jgi:hypothetical protein